MSKTKIVVVKLKELLLTTTFVVLGIAILLFVVAFFSMKQEDPAVSGNTAAFGDSTTTSALYYPGVYTSSMELNGTTIHLELVCDSNHINSVRLLHPDEAVKTMYPLLTPALEDLELQLSRNVPVEELQFTEGSTYTQMLLIEAIEKTLSKAEIPE